MPEGYVRDLYFEWLSRKVCEQGSPYKRLLSYLFDREFTYILPMDSHRASDGVYLRYHFSREMHDDRLIFDGPCTVFEMLVALAIRCEADIMGDPLGTDRTKNWFWEMITNLGLAKMTDSKFDEAFVKSRVDIFLNRNYEPNGKGGLFFIPECSKDLRTVEIWYQMLWYLDSIL